jgi:gluconate 5-dehydrogenase
MSDLRDLFDLNGKCAIVTGGSRGLGFQIAEALGEFGATLFLVSRKPADLDHAVAQLRDRGFAAYAMAADLGACDAAQAVASAAVERLGRVDILVNNAGASWGATAEDYPADGWNKVMDLNVTGLFRLTQAVARTSFLPRRTGAILNIASIEGLTGHHPDLPGTIAYNAAKGAVINLTRALAAEWGPRGVRVNALAPGYFPSKMTAVTIERSGARLLDLIPMRKFGGPDDLKGAALLLVSRAGAHITGQVLAVDGGATAI